jgi:hypothetical protein
MLFAFILCHFNALQYSVEIQLEHIGGKASYLMMTDYSSLHFLTGSNRKIGLFLVQVWLQFQNALLILSQKEKLGKSPTARLPTRCFSV